MTLWSWSGALLVGWLATSWQARFLIPVLWLVALWIALAWPKVVVSQAVASQPARALARRALASFVSVASIALQLCFWPSLQGHLPPLASQIWQSPASRTDLRARWQPDSRLCEGLGREEQVMLVWAQRFLLWCPAAKIADSYDEAAHLDAWLASQSPQAAIDAMVDLGLTHLLINEELWLAELLELPASERQARFGIKKNWQRVLATGKVHVEPANGHQAALLLYQLQKSSAKN